MKIKLQDIEIKPDNPFENCQLSREQYGKVLTEIVQCYSDGFVLAINNEWGNGKTTFVKMWQQHLENNNFQTIYFNAWENDFNNNPLVAFIAEIKTKLSIKDNKVSLNKLMEKGAVLAKNIAPSLAKSVIDKFVPGLNEILSDAAENTLKGITEIFEEEVKEYSKKKKTLIEFRNELEKIIKETNQENPFIFIIDELDRCRPTYAVEVLEQLKHFFSIKGIVFVLSIDKNHLASSIKGFYGSEEINTNEYLRRFIDLEFSIPAPPLKTFSNYLFSYYQFDEFFLSPERKIYTELKEDRNTFMSMVHLLFNKSNPTLRQQEKIFGLSRLILNSFTPNNYIYANVLFLLIYLKIMKHDLYRDINSGIISLQDISDSYYDLFQDLDRNKKYGLNLLYTEAMLIFAYNNEKPYENQIKIYTDDKGIFKTTIKSKFDESENKLLATYFRDLDSSFEKTSFKISFLLNKINLTEKVITN